MYSENKSPVSLSRAVGKFVKHAGKRDGGGETVETVTTTGEAGKRAYVCACSRVACREAPPHKLVVKS